MTPLMYASMSGLVRSMSRYARRVSSVDGMPRDPKSLAIDGRLSSAAKRPFPVSTSCLAIISSSCIVKSTSFASFNANHEIDALPSARLWPVEREVDAVAKAQVKRLKVCHMYAYRRIPCRDIVHGAPAIHAPMHDSCRAGFDAEAAPRLHRTNLVVEAPDNMT